MSNTIGRTTNLREITRRDDDEATASRAAAPKPSHEAKLDAAYDLASRHAPSIVPVASGNPRMPDVTGVVHPERTFASMAPLQTEVMRLRTELAKTSDPLLQTSLRMRVSQLSQQWCTMAGAAGWKPPTASFSPRQASDGELARALLFVEVGNTFPLGTMQSPTDVQRFKDGILEEWALRTPGMIDRVVAANPKDARLVPLLEADLARHGDKTPCKPNATVDELLRRRADLAGSQAWAKAEEDARRKGIGVDGQIASCEDLASYEMQQYILAMNPGTTMGGLLAAAAASRGGDVDDLRRAAKAGNHAEELGGALQSRGSMSSGTKTEHEKRW